LKAITETSEMVWQEIRRHCQGCDACQSDRGCQEYQSLRSKHRRVARSQGDMATIARYDREDQEAWEELDQCRADRERA
jgi:hypothetical protein